MLHITEEQVRELLPMRDCIRLIREVFKDLRTGAALNQPRRRLNLPTGSTLHSLAGAWGKYFGTKIYSSNPRVGANFFFLLFDAESARPLAQFEANYLGQIRTGAASGYATDVLASPDAATLAIVDRLAAQAIADAYGNLLKMIEHIQLGDHQGVETVDD